MDGVLPIWTSSIYSIIIHRRSPSTYPDSRRSRYPEVSKIAPERNCLLQRAGRLYTNVESLDIKSMAEVEDPVEF